MFFFLTGAVLGLFIAAPVGPVGILCVQRTLARGIAAGFVFGLGTSLADALYCAVAAFGVSAVAGFLNDNQLFLNFAGGIVLLFLGWHTFGAKPAETVNHQLAKGMFGSFLSAFVLTLLNPLMILPFAAVFAGTGLVVTEDAHLAALLICGVFTGSSAAWLVLSGIVSKLQGSLCPDRLHIVNRISGAIIAGLGVFCLIRVFIR